MREEVEASEQEAMEMLVDLFNWLEDLDPQPATGTTINRKTQNIEGRVTNRLSPKGQAASIEVKNSSDVKRRPASNLDQKQSHMDMKEKGNSQVRDGLGHMKERLKRAKEKVQGGLYP